MSHFGRSRVCRVKIIHDKDLVADEYQVRSHRAHPNFDSSDNWNNLCYKSLIINVSPRDTIVLGKRLDGLPVACREAP